MCKYRYRLHLSKKHLSSRIPALKPCKAATCTTSDAISLSAE